MADTAAPAGAMDFFSTPQGGNILAMALAMGSKLFNAPNSGADNLANMTIGMAGKQQSALQGQAMLKSLGMLGGQPAPGTVATAPTATDATPAAPSISLAPTPNWKFTPNAPGGSTGMGAPVQQVGQSGVPDMNGIMKMMLIGNLLGGQQTSPFALTPKF